VEKRPYPFLYKEENGFNLMDVSSYEQILVNENLIEHPELFKDGQECFVIINTETESPMGVELPPHVVLMVTYSEPGVKGDTATRAMKPATLETGATIQVPLFVDEGELIKVDSKTGAYIERVKG